MGRGPSRRGAPSPGRRACRWSGSGPEVAAQRRRAVRAARRVGRGLGIGRRRLGRCGVRGIRRALHEGQVGPTRAAVRQPARRITRRALAGGRHRVGPASGRRLARPQRCAEPDAALDRRGCGCGVGWGGTRPACRGGSSTNVAPSSEPARSAAGVAGTSGVDERWTAGLAGAPTAADGSASPPGSTGSGATAPPTGSGRHRPVRRRDRDVADRGRPLRRIRPSPSAAASSGSASAGGSTGTACSGGTSAGGAPRPTRVPVARRCTATAGRPRDGRGVGGTSARSMSDDRVVGVGQAAAVAVEHARTERPGSRRATSGR